MTWCRCHSVVYWCHSQLSAQVVANVSRFGDRSSADRHADGGNAPQHSDYTGFQPQTLGRNLNICWAQTAAFTAVGGPQQPGYQPQHLHKAFLHRRFGVINRTS